MPLVKCPDGIGIELVVTFWLYTGALLAVNTATEYEVAPGETFQVKVGVSVVTVWPGCEEPPGARPVGVAGAVGTFTVKYTGADMALEPAELLAVSAHT